MLTKNDLHFIFDDDNNRLKGYDATGTCVLRVEAQNAATNGPGFDHNGRCPRGEFLLGTPRERHEVPFGFWFTSILDYGNHHAMRDFHREGVGVHGGGSGLADPFAPRQGWMRTHGCVRLQNCDNFAFVELVKKAQAVGGRCYFTVIGD